MGKGTYAMGVIASVQLCMMGEVEVKFLPFWCIHTN